MNFFVVGYFGRRNLGDETILEVFLEWAQRNAPEADFRVLSSSPEETEKRHVVRAVNKGDFRAIVSAVRWCDAVVAPGGGLLQDSTSARSAMYYAALIRLARLLGKPVYLLSQGIGPLRRKWTRRFSARALAGCRRVWVRDEESAAALEGECPGFPRPPKSADMVFMLPEIMEGGAAAPAADCREKAAPGAAAGEKPPLKLGISLRPAAGLEHTAGALAGCVLRLAESHSVELNLFAFDAEEDSGPVNSFAEEIRRRAPDVKFVLTGELKDNPPDAGSVLRAVEKLDAFIGMRLHSLVFSALAGTPFVALPYDPKVRAFAHICGQPAAQDLKSASPLEISNMVKGLLEKPREEIARRLREVCAAERAQLAAAVAELLEDLSGLPSRPVISTIGIPVCGLGFNGAVRKILETARSGGRLHIVTVNPEIIMRTRREPEFHRLLAGGTMNTPDGVGVRVAALLKHRRTLEPVTGADVTSRLLELSRRKNLKIFMLGGRPEVIAAAAEKAAAHPDRPLLAGTHHGYLKDVDPAALAKQIRDSGADLVLVGMGVPMQEYWIRDNAEAAGAKVYIGVGGVFDVLAGKTARAPAFMRKAGLEWLWRVAGDPKRIVRLASIPAFVLLALTEALWKRDKKKQ